jgi:hypothetical protein
LIGVGLIGASVIQESLESRRPLGYITSPLLGFSKGAIIDLDVMVVSGPTSTVRKSATYNTALFISDVRSMHFF